MSVFGDKPVPRAVVKKITELVAAGEAQKIYDEGTPVNALLRKVGVYDDRQPRLHMLRIRIPGGRLNAAQTRAIGQIADELCERPPDAEYQSEDFPERFLELTTRQNIQLHWIRMERLPEIWRRLEAVGINSLQACGDTTRNITGCPVDGLDKHAFFDVGKQIDELNTWLLDHPEESANLPRKFKIALTGCCEDCILSGVNDMAFLPARRNGEYGFHLRLGGGLSDYPRLATELDAFIRFEQVLPVVRVCCQVYKDFGVFEDKAANRFRRVVSELGMDRIKAEFQKRLDFTLEPPGESLTSHARYDHVGVHEQRQDGLRYVGLAVPVGRMQGTELIEAARLAETYGDGSVRVTPRQNLILGGIPAERVDDLLRESLLQAYSPKAPSFRRSIVACTSAPFCKFGIQNTKRAGVAMANELDEFFRDADLGPIRVHMSGCKASCAQVQIADIGLRSSIAKDENDMYPAFDICIGGNPTFGKLARWVKGEVPVPSTIRGIKNLVTDYQKQRTNGETFGEYVRRRDEQELAGYFEGIKL